MNDTIQTITGKTLILQPRCYDDLRQQARQQLEHAMWSLEERADQLRKFIEHLPTIETPDEIHALAKATRTYDDEDHLVPAITHLINEWPHVKSPDYW